MFIDQSMCFFRTLVYDDGVVTMLKISSFPCVNNLLWNLLIPGTHKAAKWTLTYIHAQSS